MLTLELVHWLELAQNRRKWKREKKINKQRKKKEKKKREKEQDNGLETYKVFALTHMANENMILIYLGQSTAHWSDLIILLKARSHGQFWT